MRKIFLIMFLLLLNGCSTQDVVYIHCDDGHGHVFKGDMKFYCPFAIQKRNGSENNWIDVEKPTIISKDESDYFPVNKRNFSYAYNIQMKVPKKYFTNENYNVWLKAVDVNDKEIGEYREVIFYRVAEVVDTVIYHTWIFGETYKEDYGRRIFFAQREMPSFYNWYSSDNERMGYDVLNIGEKRGGFIITGEIKE